jgi:hypothetical protein
VRWSEPPDLPLVAEAPAPVAPPFAAAPPVPVSVPLLLAQPPSMIIDSNKSARFDMVLSGIAGLDIPLRGASEDLAHSIPIDGHPERSRSLKARWFRHEARQRDANRRISDLTTCRRYTKKSVCIVKGGRRRNFVKVTVPLPHNGRSHALFGEHDVR